jgi:hypothetical protein
LRRSGSLLAVERLGLDLAVLLQENFHFAFSILQLFSAGGGKLHSFFEKSQRFFQGYLTLFQFLNDLFQALNAFFKFRQREKLLGRFYTRPLVETSRLSSHKNGPLPTASHAEAIQALHANSRACPELAEGFLSRCAGSE